LAYIGIAGDCSRHFNFSSPAAAMTAQGATVAERFKDGPIETAERHVACFLRDPDGQAIYLVSIPGETLAEAASAGAA
jgi:hypothetical protein